MKEVLIFDTEFTAWSGSVARSWRGPGEFKEIVQIGAVILDATRLDEKANFSVLIKPVLNPTLSNYFERLTRITNERLEQEGVSFTEGVTAFMSFAKGRKSYCYGRDDKIILENEKKLQQVGLWKLSASVNLRTWLERVGVPLAGIQSGELAAHVGAQSQGQAHDALTDARSLAAAIRYLVAKGAPNPFLHDEGP